MMYSISTWGITWNVSSHVPTKLQMLRNFVDTEIILYYIYKQLMQGYLRLFILYTVNHLDLNKKNQYKILLMMKITIIIICI